MAAASTTAPVTSAARLGEPRRHVSSHRHAPTQIVAYAACPLG